MSKTCKSTFNATLLSGIFVALLLAASIATADDAVSTFEAFYESSSGVNWITGGLIAVAVGILVFLGAAVVFPAAVAAIGTSIGGLAGLSGAAATNFGLALVGGGSLAAGGGGIALGSALLAAALTFSTEIAVDYSVNRAQATYNRAQFEKESLSMMTLPPPRNVRGTESLEAAQEILDNSAFDAAFNCTMKMPSSTDDLKSCYVMQQTRSREELAKAAIQEIGQYRETGGTTLADRERKATMLALLHFIGNDYESAAAAASLAYARARELDQPASVPAFILAVSRLYDERPEISQTHALFTYAVASEPDNPLTPVLFASYLDRLSSRVYQGGVPISQLDKVATFARSLQDDDRKLMIQQGLLTHYVKHLKLTQSEVLSRARARDLSSYERSMNNAKMRIASNNHRWLLRVSERLLERQFALLKKLNAEPGYWDRAKDLKNPFGDAPTSRQQSLDKLNEVLVDYHKAIAAYDRGAMSLATVATRGAPVG